MRQTQGSVPDTAVRRDGEEEDHQGQSGGDEGADDEHDGEDEHSVGGAHHVAEEGGEYPGGRPGLSVVVESSEVEGDEGDQETDNLQPGCGPAQ